MKRYFHTTIQPGTFVPSGATDPYHCGSEWNYLTLPDGSYLVCMFTEHFAPDPSWIELPHLLETTALPSAVMTAIGSMVAAPANCTTFQLARLLSAHNARFHP